VLCVTVNGKSKARTDSGRELSKPIGSHGQHPGLRKPQHQVCYLMGALSTGSLESDASWGGSVAKHETTKFTTRPMNLTFE
jgi:hypothetical protein